MGSCEVNHVSLGGEVNNINYTGVITFVTCTGLLKSKLVVLSSLPIYIC